MAVVVVVFRVIESLFGERISLAFRRTFFSYADLMTKIFGVTIDEKDTGGERSDTHQEGSSEDHTS